MFQGKLTFIPLAFAMVSGASHGQSLPTAGSGAELREAGTGRIWLDPRTREPALRAALLGEK